MRDPALLEGRTRYERVMHGWVDNLHEDALTHTVRLGDDDRGLEVAIVALPSPTYAIHEARLTPLTGDVAPSVVGFARPRRPRRWSDAPGRDPRRRAPGGALAVDATIEVGASPARWRRCRAPRPTARPRVIRSTAGASTRRAGRAAEFLLCLQDADAACSARARVAQMSPDLYSPRPGQRRVFERRKVARLERVDGRLRLFHSMHDNVHGFEITYEIDLATQKVVRAEHITPRLPYMGICSEPQRRITSLLGETADAGLRKRIQTTLGGEHGCGQLYDLTADLLKLLA
jgi:hypothetical protein